MRPASLSSDEGDFFVEMGNAYELLYMIRMRDEEALNILVEQSRPHLKMTLRQLLGIFRRFYSSFDDLLQEAMILQVQTVDLYSELRGSYAGYMHVVTRNSMLRFFRRETADIRNEKLTCSIDAWYVNEEESYYDYLPQTDRLSEPHFRVRFDDALRKAMDEISGLSTQERDVFFCMQDDLTYAQGAEKLGMEKKRYDYCVQKARRLIRKAVMKDLSYNPS
ncbi:MAG TPA: sigma-70 family RNA polymerase sigma factor [Erysipelotrichaceae bacterium]|jgi:RNA polymerase sigma factor (sigma-70 family)|nr:sigma-70 family RNA polymerase sigma factor [Erysipelotrichaceae bacterium]HCW55522.1 sigma-70 family RNA polymerase sigma factor [Erysipelotrichaceae bacterium]